MNTRTTIIELFEAARLSAALAEQWLEHAERQHKSIDECLLDSGVIAAPESRTLRMMVAGYANLSVTGLLGSFNVENAKALETAALAPPVSSSPAPAIEPAPAQSVESAPEIEAAPQEPERDEAETPQPALELPALPALDRELLDVALGPVPIGFGSAEAWLGTRIGPYVLHEFLGEGSTCRVFAGRHEILGTTRVIKLVARGADPELLVRECTLLTEFDHPNIARLVEFDVDRGVPYAVLEYREGQTLARHLEAQGELGEELAVRLATQMSAALQYCHERDILHLDIKPANILITPDEQFVLIDFGLAAMGREEESGALFRGTPAYASPEQIVDPEQVGPRSDLYSLGLTVHEALAGPASQATGEGATFSRHLFRELPSLAELMDVSPRTSRVVSELTKRPPLERPESAADVLRFFDQPQEPVLEVAV
ncbi:MAG: serine/threonine-protein kinase [Myxococcota bacterium]